MNLVPLAGALSNIQYTIIMQVIVQQLSAANAQCRASAQPARRSVASAVCGAFGTRRNPNKSKMNQQPKAKPFGGSSGNGRPNQHVTRAAAAAEVGKLISKVEIPAFIPRTDLIDQMLRWAFIEIQEGGVGNVGCPCKVRCQMQFSAVQPILASTRCLNPPCMP